MPEVLSRVLTELVLAIAIIASLTGLELIAPVERISIQSRVRGLILRCVGGLAGAALLYIFHRGWAALGVTPLIRIPISGLLGNVIGSGLGLIFADFCGYWNRRFQHRFLWPIHAVHHSITELSAAACYGHFLERGLQFLLFALPLSLVSFEWAPLPFVIVALRSISESYIHSPTKLSLGPASILFVDNRYHRIHHSIEAQHAGKNFGVLLSIWDRMFGTIRVPTAAEWPRTGIVGQPPPRTLVDYLLFPARVISAAPSRMPESPTERPRRSA